MSAVSCERCNRERNASKHDSREKKDEVTIDNDWFVMGYCPVCDSIVVQDRIEYHTPSQMSLEEAIDMRRRLNQLIDMAAKRKPSTAEANLWGTKERLGHDWNFDD